MKLPYQLGKNCLKPNPNDKRKRVCWRPRKMLETEVKDQEKNTAEKKAVEGHRLIDMTILAQLIGELSCPECHDDHSKLFVCTDTSKRKGLA